MINILYLSILRFFDYARFNQIVMSKVVLEVQPQSMVIRMGFLENAKVCIHASSRSWVEMWRSYLTFLSLSFHI